MARGTTWSRADIGWGVARFTWEEFSLAYELSLIRGNRSLRSREYDKFWDKFPEKKERFIELYLKVNGVDMRDKAKLTSDVEVSISDIDLVIQEVLQKPKVSISVT